jgi:hypothetical protein
VFALQKALLGEKEPEHRGEMPFLDQLKGMFRRGRQKARRRDAAADAAKTGET